MAEVSLQQIVDKLNNEFVAGERRLIFWYDDTAEFYEDIQEIGSKLLNAELLIMNANEQFKTKTIIERQKPKTSFLVYSPATKPEAKLNFLMDELEYSKEFTADRTTFVALEIGIPTTLRPLMAQHNSFFANKERVQKLNNLRLAYRDDHELLLGMMAVLTNQKTADIEGITRAVLDDALDETNKYLIAFEKFNLVNAFWEEINLHFGYHNETPTVIKLASALILNLTFVELQAAIPNSYALYRVSRESTVAVFMANYMNNKIYSDRYDEIAKTVYQYLDADNLFQKMPLDLITKASSFKQFDERILSWSKERLMNGDYSAAINGMTVSDLADIRPKLYYGTLYDEDYHVIKHAAALLENHDFKYGSANEMVVDYTNGGFSVDRHYRKFYQHLHLTQNQDQYADLRQLVEKTYVEYLSQSISQWNKVFDFNDVRNDIQLQRDFYQKHIAPQSANTAVIISDAFRYEAALELADTLKHDTKNVVDVQTAITGLPSITPFGMAQLLPHKTITFDTGKKGLVIDDKYDTNTTEARDKILKMRNAQSSAIQFDVIKKMSIAELRDFRANQEVIYIYHNQIDAVGDARKTEDEVFEATNQAIQEIRDLIKRLSTSAGIGHFIVTADHGYIYREDSVDTAEKIDLALEKDDKLGQRYLISEKAYHVPGVTSVRLGDILDNTDNHIVNYPKNINVYQSAGGGRNYVHGGSSIQEMLIPVVHVNVKRGRSENRPATLNVVTPSNRITNLLTNIEFLQNEPISEVVTPADYKVYFVSESNEVISNEVLISANLKDNNVNERRFRMAFTFKDRKYDRTDNYYMVVVNTKSGVEEQRISYVMDIALAGGFGFDI